MRQLIRWSVALAAMLALWGMSQSGMLASLDIRLSDWRLAAVTTPASGSTILVEIDSKSLSEIGVWPWPRSLHASLLDHLMEAGAEEVAFDIDFSSASVPFDDSIFSAALEQAGGYAWLAAFAQASPDGSMSFSRPLPEFAASADPVLVNVLVDTVTGRAHSLPVAATDAEGTIVALPAQLARPAVTLPSILEIDFSLDMAGITRLSFTDVLYGRVDPAIITGKQVIVGASAIELRDFFTVPRYGVISGPMLQAMALETLKAGRILAHWGSLPGILVIVAFAITLLMARRRSANLPLVVISLLASAAIGEAAALLAYSYFDVIINTAGLHVGLLFLLGLVLADNGYLHLLGRRAAQQRLQFLATHDPVTGLLSRQGLLDLPDTDAGLAMVVLQIQSQDELHATLGHEVVESLLINFAHRLGHSGFKDVARTAPAIFALADIDDGDHTRLSEAVRQLTVTLSGTYNVSGHNLHVDIIAGYATGSASRAELLNRAEIALIQARTDRTAVRGFSRADQEALDRHRRLDSDLRRALGRNQLRLIFQPQIDLRTRQIIGAETLLRWEHPEFGLVSPTEFIPLAEETGLIIDLGRFVLWEACRQAVFWPSPITVAVNVSPIQFQHADLIKTVEAALSRSGLPASRLELEITESSSVTEPGRVRDVMWRLQALGIRLSIDDFGTGYSSLSYFRDLPFETVKIDQGFVRGRTSETDRTLLAAIIELSRKMGKLTIAEGVEDEATATLLTQMGCTMGQGYHFSRPIQGDELCALLLAEQQREQA
ncbi:putative bifunctional diguanylate cyclase/phosphodiesterase [Devosia sp. CAU 1758]